MSGLDSEGARRLLARPEVRACLGALAGEGEETRLVGGCVRDALLGRDVADIDLATTLEPEQTLARARRAGLKAVPTGIAHGTITVIVAGMPFEVTTLREDVETDGRHAIVRFGRDFGLDAQRRDFTINALSLDTEGHLHDVGDGVADLATGRVRFIGDAATRIREDALRILRFFRFHARYGRGDPDHAALAACVAARDGLDRLSRERVRSEFLKLLMAPGVIPAVEVLAETGLLLRITGTVAELGRLARACAAGAPDHDRLAALSVQTVEDGDRLRETLRLSRSEHASLTAYALALAGLRSPERIDRAILRRLIDVHGAPEIRSVTQATRGEPRPFFAPDAEAEIAGGGLERDPPVFPVTGADLVAGGLPPGPAIGRALAAARRRWLDEGCPVQPDDAARLIAYAIGVART